ncbi:hypothetical protein EMIT0111MI5_30077 [Burkholderia sp. IT-111MI5]
MRGRPFRHSGAVPGTALSGILISMNCNVKCLMSYIRVGGQDAGERGGAGETAFPCVLRRVGWEPLRARYFVWFLRLSAGGEAICGGLLGCGWGRPLAVDWPCRRWLS